MSGLSSPDPDKRMNEALLELEYQLSCGKPVQLAIEMVALEYSFSREAIRLRGEKALGQLDQVADRASRAKLRASAEADIRSAIEEYSNLDGGEPAKAWLTKRLGYEPRPSEVEEAKERRNMKLLNSIWDS